MHRGAALSGTSRLTSLALSFHSCQAWDLDFITSSQGLGACQVDLSDTFDTAMRKRIRKLKNGTFACSKCPLLALLGCYLSENCADACLFFRM